MAANVTLTIVSHLATNCGPGGKSLFFIHSIDFFIIYSIYIYKYMFYKAGYFIVLIFSSKTAPVL